jgi:LPXTG-motif cell wall-anchored protein
MRLLRSLALTAFAGCLSVALVPTVHADEWNKKTNLTVNEPIQLPSCCTPDHTVTLQPGEYVLMLVDSLSDRHIVRVFDKDQQHVITTILAIPNYRLQPTGNTVLQYWEVPAGQPKALRAWFYPGDNFGQEFAYPKQTAAQIAAFVKVPVPAIAIDTTAAEELKTAPLVVVDESGKASELAQVTPPPAPQPTVQTEPAQPQETAQAPERPSPMPMAPIKQELPHTASGMPLVGLLGFVSMGAAALLRIRSRRSRK